MKEEVRKILKINIIIIGITKIIIGITKIIIEITKIVIGITKIVITKDQAQVQEIIIIVTDTVKNPTKKIRKDQNGNPKNQIPVQMKKIIKAAVDLITNRKNHPRNPNKNWRKSRQK